MKHSPAFGAVAACAVFLSISPVAAADFTSNSGKVYKNYRVLETTAQGLKIAHSEGLTYLLYSDLPYEVAGPYSADLQTRSGRVLKKYSVAKVSHKSLKILHDSGSSWIPHGELPEFLLKRYEKEIREEKARHEEKMKKMAAEAAQNALKASHRTIDFAAQTKAFLTEAGLTEKEIGELNNSITRIPAFLRKLKQKRQSSNSAGSSNPDSDFFFFGGLPHVEYDPLDYSLWQEKDRRWVPSKKDVLHVAIQVKNLSKVAQLLEAGINPNIISSADDTPLICAIKEGHLDTIVLLLNFGANINGKNNRGETPLCWSVVTHNIELSKFLISRGADPNAGVSVGEALKMPRKKLRSVCVEQIGIWRKCIKTDEESFKTAEVLASGGAECYAGNLIDLSGEWLTRYCKILYKENWQTKEAEVKRMQAERERRRREAAAAAARARQNRSYGSGSGGGRTCPDCHGSGKSFSSYRTRRGGIFDTHTSVGSCSTCGGSGRY